MNVATEVDQGQEGEAEEVWGWGHLKFEFMVEIQLKTNSRVIQEKIEELW